MRFAWCAFLLVALAGRAGGEAPNVVTGRLTAGPAQATVEMTIAPGWHVNAHEPRDEFLIPTTLTVTPPPGVRPGAVAYPAPVEKKLAFSGGKALLLYEGTVRFTTPLEGAGAGPLRAALRYQACDDTRCLPPRTLELAAELGEPPAGANATPHDQVALWIERWGLGLTLVWVALLGVALNLTPCVYPLVSVTVAFFGGRTAGEGTAVRRALLYVLGICVTFSILGVVAALTGSLFGAALQRPAVLGTIAAVLVLLAASNFGLYQLRLPAPLVQRLGRVGEGDLGAFVMGLTMGAVAAPCIGPIVVALLIFVGTQQSAGLGFALFFALGFGMGAPYVGLAALAGRLRRLPRAGAWLAWVEQVFGFLLLGLALYFASPLLSEVFVRVATALLLVAAGIVLGFLGAEGSSAFVWARRAGGLALVALALGGFIHAEVRSGVAWTPFSEEALARAAAAGRPVLIDFQAEWCIPCREMENTTFRDAAFARVARSFETREVDVTAADERASALMTRFQALGVPTYILLGADGVERRRFVGFVPAPEMVAAMLELVPAGRA
jgi:thiol:disulfide interchange protein DsbD